MQFLSGSSTLLNQAVDVSRGKLGIKPETPTKPANLLKRETSLDSGQWTEITIELHKKPGKGLGIAVTGGPKQQITEAITVKRLVPDSIAALDGRLRKDDKITHINSRELIGMSQGDALSLLKEIPKDIVLTCKRKNESPGKSPNRSEDLGDSPTRTEGKSRSRSGSGAGLSLVARARKRLSQVQEEVWFDIETKGEVPFTIGGGEDTMYGESPITITAIGEGGSSFQLEDTLTMVNNKDFDGFSLEEAQQFLHSLPPGRVTALVFRKK